MPAMLYGLFMDCLWIAYGSIYGWVKCDELLVVFLLRQSVPLEKIL